MPELKLSHAPGAAIYYELHGDTGPWLVLVNGMSQSTASWMSQTRHLREQFRVVTYDSRGQFRSPLGGSTPSIDDHVGDLCAVLDAVGATEVHLCGFSHGARIALRTAATASARVSSLVLTSTGADNDAMRRTIIRRWLEVLNLGGLEAMAWCSLTDILGRSYIEANERFVEAMMRATVQRNSTEALRTLLVAMRDFPDPLPDAAAVRCPTLLIRSLGDLLVSAESSQLLAEHFADCELVTIDDCGHTIPIERADPWRAAVVGFVLRTMRR